MSPQTLKMLVMFLLAAALLNITNYLFYWLYDPPSRQAMRVEVQVSEHTKFIRRITKRRVTRVPKWSDFLLCESKNSSSASPAEANKLAGTPEYDYRDQNPDSSAFYYYNGIKKGDKFCPEIPPGLGPFKADVFISPREIEKLYDVLQLGGIYEETECVPRQNVAVIVAYRENENELIEFVYSMHSFLMKQQLEYQIFVVKQSNKTTPLNPGKLFNVGFTEAQGMKKIGEWRCMVFHEHNIVPADSRNLYRCSNYPQQLVNQLGNRSYEYEFGGAIAVKPQQFLKVNGFSNMYQIDNDAAFEDLQKRLIQANFTTSKSSKFGKYERVKYTDENYEARNHQPMQTSSPLNLIDGLSTLSYTLNLIDLKPMYTLIDVNIDKPQINATNMWERLLNQATTAGTTMKKSLV